MIHSACAASPRHLPAPQERWARLEGDNIDVGQGCDMFTGSQQLIQGYWTPAAIYSGMHDASAMAQSTTVLRLHRAQMKAA